MKALLSVQVLWSITYDSDCFHRELGGSTKLVIDVIRYDPPNVKVQDTVGLVPRLLGTRLKILYSHTCICALFRCLRINGNEESECIIATAQA